MDVVYELSAVCVVVLGLLAGAFSFTDHRDLALWATCIAIMFAVLGGFAYCQDCLWESDAAKAIDPTKSDLVHTTMASLGTPLTSREPVEIDWTIKNSAHYPLFVMGSSATTVVREVGNDDFAAELERHMQVAKFNELNALLTPGGEAGCTMPSKKTLSTEDFGAITGGEKVLFLVGCVLYRDSQEEIRATKFCQYYNPRRKKFMTGPHECNAMGIKVAPTCFNTPSQPLLNYSSAEMLSFEPNKEIDFKITFANSGGLTATLTKKAMSSGFGFISEENDIAIRKELLTWKEMPNQVHETVPGLSELNYLPSKKSESDERFFAAVENGEKVFFIWGRLEYTDQEGDCFWTNFCLTYNGKELKKYKDFNEVGECDSTQKPTHTPPSSGTEK